MSLRVYEGLGGFYVGRAPWRPASQAMHATREQAERELRHLQDRDNEAAWDYAQRFHRLVRGATTKGDATT